jgi:hypothetical protein
MFAGTTMVGGCASLTVTAKAHEPWFLLASVEEHVTVEVPFGNVDPLGGEQVTAPTPGQLSLAASVV